jgi:acyl-CoA thioesterase-1
MRLFVRKFFQNGFFSVWAAVFLLACNSQPAEKTDQATPPIASPDSASDGPVDQKAGQKAILFFGNSLTAGYGLDPEQAFPALIQQRIDSLGLGYRVVNAGLSGETTTGGLERIDFLLRQPYAVVVVELGGNDGLRGIDPALSKKNLQGIIDKIRQKDAQARIVLAGMEAPPSMGQDYTRVFRGMYQELAEANQVALIPFLLERVGGDPKLNLPDGIHPTPEGHKIVAETVWQVLKTVLQ